MNSRRGLKPKKESEREFRRRNAASLSMSVSFQAKEIEVGARERRRMEREDSFSQKRHARDTRHDMFRILLLGMSPVPKQGRW